MSQVMNITVPGAGRRSWRDWLRRPTIVRVAAVGFVVVIGMTVLLAMSRRGVWAVNRAGGTFLSAEPAAVNSLQKLEAILPASLQPPLRWIETQAREWLPLDSEVSAVNLTRTRVDSHWLPTLKSMSSLELLSIEPHQLGSGLESLQTLSRLREIKIVQARDQTDFESLLPLEHLERICLVNPHRSVQGIAAIGRLPALKELEIEALGPDSNGWGTLLHQCEGWGNVTMISIRSLFPVTPGLETLSTVESLRRLEISAPLNATDLAALVRITQLTHVTLNTNSLPAEEWRLLSGLPHLKSLQLFTQGQEVLPLEALRRALPECEIRGRP